MAKHTHVAKPRIDMINLYPLKPTYTERKANYTNSTTPTYQYIQPYIYRDISALDQHAHANGPTIQT